MEWLFLISIYSINPYQSRVQFQSVSYFLVMVKATYDSTPLLRIFVPKISYSLLYGSPIFPILSFSFHFSILPSLIFSFSFFLLILSNLSFSFSFYFFQFLFNRPQYSSLNLLSSHLYNIFTMYLPGSFPFLSFLLFFLFLALLILLYFSSNSFTKSLSRTEFRRKKI